MLCVLLVFSLEEKTRMPARRFQLVLNVAVASRCGRLPDERQYLSNKSSPIHDSFVAYGGFS
jgi:hypothetical protein